MFDAILKRTVSRKMQIVLNDPLKNQLSLNEKLALFSPAELKIINQIRNEIKDLDRGFAASMYSFGNYDDSNWVQTSSSDKGIAHRLASNLILNPYGNDAVTLSVVSFQRDRLTPIKLPLLSSNTYITSKGETIHYQYDRDSGSFLIPSLKQLNENDIIKKRFDNHNHLTPPLNKVSKDNLNNTHLHVSAFFENKDSNKKTNEKMVIVYRGTEPNIDSITKSYLGAYNNLGKYSRQMEIFEKELFEHIKENPQIKEIELTGHSLGGALAQYFHEKHFHKFKDLGISLKTTTVGSPGSPKLLDANLSKKDILSLDQKHFKNAGDPIPLVAELDIYQKNGKSIPLDNIAINNPFLINIKAHNNAGYNHNFVNRISNTLNDFPLIKDFKDEHPNYAYFSQLFNNSLSLQKEAKKLTAEDLNKVSEGKLNSTLQKKSFVQIDKDGAYVFVPVNPSQRRSIQNLNSSVEKGRSDLEKILNISHPEISDDINAVAKINQNKNEFYNVSFFPNQCITPPNVVSNNFIMSTYGATSQTATDILLNNVDTQRSIINSSIYDKAKDKLIKVGLENSPTALSPETLKKYNNMAIATFSSDSEEALTISLTKKLNDTEIKTDPHLLVFAKSLARDTRLAISENQAIVSNFNEKNINIEKIIPTQQEIASSLKKINPLEYINMNNSLNSEKSHQVKATVEKFINTLKDNEKNQDAKSQQHSNSLGK